MCVCVRHGVGGWKKSRKELRLELELNFSSFLLKLCKYVHVHIYVHIHTYIKYVTNMFLSRLLDRCQKIKQ